MQRSLYNISNFTVAGSRSQYLCMFFPLHTKNLFSLLKRETDSWERMNKTGKEKESRIRNKSNSEMLTTSECAGLEYFVS